MEFVNAADWGILPGNHRDLTARMAGLLARLAGQRDVCLRMEPGEYHFYPQGVPLYQWNISNHDLSDGQATGIFLQGWKDFTLDGGGSRWIFHTEMLPCQVADCENLHLKNFSVEYARPAYSEGIIRQVSPQQMTVWIDPDQYPWCLEDGRLVFWGENFRHALHLWLEMDENTRRPAWGTDDLYICTQTQKVGLHPEFQVLGRDLVQITLRGEERFFAGSRVGNRLIFRHHPRTSPAVYVTDSRNICCENIRIFHTPGMGFLAERCEDVTLQQFVVAPQPESGRYFSAAADGAHFVNCGGTLRLEACRFENQLDDGLNVHGFYAVVLGQPAPRQLLLGWGHPMQRGVRLARPGDVLALMPADTLRPHWTGRICRVFDDGGNMAVELETPPPVLPAGGWVAENLTLSPDVQVKNCLFRGNRARGMLLTCRRALVEGCTLDVPGAAVYLEGEAQYWYESGAVQELILRGNQFVNCSYIPAWGQAPITVCPKVRHGEGYYHGRIVLENNHFSCFDRRMVWAREVEELCLTDNQFTPTEAYPPTEGECLDLANYGCLRQEHTFQGEPQSDNK